MQGKKYGGWWNKWEHNFSKSKGLAKESRQNLKKLKKIIKEPGWQIKMIFGWK